MVGAYILVTTDAGNAGTVAAGIAKIDGVRSVSAVTGPYDVIAEVEVSDFNAIGALIVSEIQKIDGVSRTLSCIRVNI
ncbi:MAG: Lrp/AsnC family transcriptional regulator [Terriglobia bacterium]